MRNSPFQNIVPFGRRHEPLEQLSCRCKDKNGSQSELSEDCMNIDIPFGFAPCGRNIYGDYLGAKHRSEEDVCDTSADLSRHVPGDNTYRFRILTKTLASSLCRRPALLHDK